VEIEDTTHKLAALALQGPRSRAVLNQVVDFDLDRMRFFRVRRMKLAGKDVWVSRTGYTGDLGFEIWMQNEDALACWDAIVEAGAPHRLEPIGLDALDVSRLEAGFVLQGVDYFSARTALIESRKSSPWEAALGQTVELDREPFVGQDALRAERTAGSKWALVAVELSWPELEALYDQWDLPPALAPVAWRTAVPIYGPDGRTQVGQATSGTWSPLLKKNIAMATVLTRYGAPGTRLKMEYTVEYERRTVTATVVEKPLFDPERKRSVPAGGRQ
jgi:aminomethyltransferase